MIFINHRVTGMSDDTEALVEARVRTELFVVQGFCWLSTCDELGNYVYPLLWWKECHIQYPVVWELAQKILCNPATSAPVERVFSSPANIIDKKRCDVVECPTRQ